MLKVISSGVYATVQDLGRFGYMNVGVPMSGAMDHYSAKLSNLMLGNDENDALIEITLGGSSFQFLKDTTICLGGADLNAKLNNEPIHLNHPIKILKNSILKFSNPNYGSRTYLAVKGGFLNKNVLGSRSFFKEITKKYVLKKDDEILYDEVKTLNHSLSASVKIKENHCVSTTIEVYEGPEYDMLATEQRKLLIETMFTISKENNRMGYRLDELMVNKLDAILTSAVMPGTIQLTPSGKMIILMRDCQVTGGYPRVLQLSDDAINKLAQKSTGDSFHLRIIPLE